MIDRSPRALAGAAFDAAGLVLLGYLLWSIGFERRIWYESIALWVAAAGVAGAMVTSPSSLRTRVEIPLLLYVGASVVAWSINVTRYPITSPGDGGAVAAWQPLLHTVLLGAYVYAVVWLLRTAERLQLFVSVFVIGVSWIAARASAYSLSIGLEGRIYDYPGLVQWSGYHPISLLCELALPFPLAYAVAGRSKAGRAGAAVIAAVLGAHLAIIQAKGAVIGAAVAIVAMAFVVARRGRKAALIVGAALVLGTLAALPVVRLPFHSIRWEATSMDQGSRVDIWARTLRLVRDNAAFGVGPDHYFAAMRSGYQNSASEYYRGYDVSAHNLFLQVAAERGVVAAAAFIALWCVVLKRLWDVGLVRTSAGVVVYGAFGALLAYLAEAQGDQFVAGFVVSGKIDYLTWTLLAVGISASRLCAAEKTRERPSDAVAA